MSQSVDFRWFRSRSLLSIPRHGAMAAELPPPTLDPPHRDIVASQAGIRLSPGASSMTKSDPGYWRMYLSASFRAGSFVRNLANTLPSRPKLQRSLSRRTKNRWRSIGLLLHSNVAPQNLRTSRDTVKSRPQQDPPCGPRAVTIVIPEAGHLASLEAPDAFNRAVESVFGAIGD
jgi:pimeloyl-ACP methyl ester carboxylesterase